MLLVSVHTFKDAEKNVMKEWVGWLSARNICSCFFFSKPISTREDHTKKFESLNKIIIINGISFAIPNLLNFIWIPNFFRIAAGLGPYQN